MMQILAGSSRGVAAKASPSARLAVAGVLSAAVIISDATCFMGSLLIALLLLSWLLACAFPVRMLARALLAGMALLVSTWGVLALGAWMGEGSIRMSVAWSVALKSTAMGSLAWATFRTFRLGLLLRTLSGWPGAMLLEQIAKQTLNLLDESRRISQAWVLRGATKRCSFGFLKAAPAVWLPRVAHRAERVASAMDLRGLPSLALFRDPEAFRGREMLLMAGGLLGLGLAAWLRWAAP